MKLEALDMKKLKKDDSNPNKMTAAKFDALKRSIEKFGELQPVIIDQDNRILDGHHRFDAYLELGKKTVPAIRVNLQSKADRKLLRQLMNKLRGDHEKKKDVDDINTILADEAYDIAKISSFLGESENSINALLASTRDQPTKTVSFEAKESDTKKFRFEVSAEHARVIQQALDRTEMKEPGDALHAVCKSYLG